MGALFGIRLGGSQSGWQSSGADRLMDGRPLSTLSKEVSFTSPARSDPDTALADVGDSAKDNYRPAGNGTQCCCCEIVTTFQSDLDTDLGSLF